MKKVLITGEKRIGKSSIVKKLVDPYRDSISGFFTQRVYGVMDKTCLFRMVDLSSKEKYCLEIHENSSMNKYEDVFLSTKISDQSYKNIEIFNTIGSSILKNSLIDRKALIVIDEIGKFEEEALTYMDMLEDALNSDIPVLGVLKAYDTNLKDKIMKMTEIEIIELTSKNHDMVERRILDYLSKECSFY